MLSRAIAFGLLPVLALASWMDLRSRTVANRLLLFGLVLLLGLSRWTIDGVGYALAGGLVGLLVFLPFYLKRGMGAGDIKLMGLVGCYLGPAGVLVVALYSALAGGALAVLALTTGLLGRRLPYAVAISLGVLWYLRKSL